MRTMPAYIRKRKHPNPPHPISDHALIRFIERTGVLDIKGLRAELYTKGLRAAVKESAEHQSKIFYKENGLEFVVFRGRVVTITTPDMLTHR